MRLEPTLKGRPRSEVNSNDRSRSFRTLPSGRDSEPPYVSPDRFYGSLKYGVTGDPRGTRTPIQAIRATLWLFELWDRRRKCVSERGTGLEPATFTMARCCSTIELPPRGAKEHVVKEGSGGRDLNPQHPTWKDGALPIELPPRVWCR